MSPVVAIIIAVAALAAGIGAGFFLGYKQRKKLAEAKIGSAELEAKRIVDEAAKEAENSKKSAVIAAKEEILREKNEAEKELKEQRREISRQEQRIVSKEEALDRKNEALDRKNELLSEKINEAEQTKAEIDEVLAKHMQELQRISGCTAEEAKAELLQRIEQDVQHDAALKIIEIESRLKEEADRKAKDIISLAIQRCASDHVSETTVSTVTLPSDDMKGRIIGREGRNIRALETLTGVDLIIDDTPEAITLSSFDPIRREVARVALEKLILDGRIHPARIEETVEKARKEIDRTIKQEGENAVLAAGVRNLNPELVSLLGRLRYRTSYGQNVLNHSLEVAHLSGLMAAELGENVALAKRAGLLHDIGKALDHEHEGTHIQLGVEVAKKHNENEIVINAIHAHHGDVEPKSAIACIVQAADAISAARPGARRENIENYVKRLEQLEEIANSFGGVESSYAIQAGREIRIMVKPDQVSDDQMITTARDIVKRIESEMEYPGQIKVQVVRESRAIDYAK